MPRGGEKGLHDGHRKRLKQSFLAQPGVVEDHQLLELLLFYCNPRSDTNETAHQLLNQFGSIAGVLDADPVEVVKLDKIGDHAAVLFKVVKELARRYLAVRADVSACIQNSKDAYQVLAHYFFGARSEMLYVLCLDGKQKFLGVRKVGEGDVNTVQISPRLVAQAALSLNAACVIVAHNHVSGLAFPSREDRIATKELQQILDGVGVQLIDHLIFVDDDMVSLRDSGFLEV
ncbi:MAG: DNA repair protein RadC [Oscillospiraceae bacterium]|nr:DNA repair protein RadC [Oscillospiraceae bacterium]